jgi:polyhydroxyalkanoate synthesis regulator phasin
MWTDERITRELQKLFGHGGIRLETVAPIMRKMRDESSAHAEGIAKTFTKAQLAEMLSEYGPKVAELEAENAALRQRVAELEAVLTWAQKAYKTFVLIRDGETELVRGMASTAIYYAPAIVGEGGE